MWDLAKPPSWILMQGSPICPRRGEDPQAPSWHWCWDNSDSREPWIDSFWKFAHDTCVETIFLKNRFLLKIDCWKDLVHSWVQWLSCHNTGDKNMCHWNASTYNIILGTINKGHLQFFLDFDPLPLVPILTRPIALNSGNLPYHVCFWTTHTSSPPLDDVLNEWSQIKYQLHRAPQNKMLTPLMDLRRSC